MAAATVHRLSQWAAKLRSMPSHCLPLAKDSMRSFTPVRRRPAAAGSRSSTSGRRETVMLKLRSRSTATSSMFTRFCTSTRTKPSPFTSATVPTAPMGRKLSAVRAARAWADFCISSVTRSPSAGALPVSSL